MNYVRILSEFHGRCWAVPEGLLLRMQEFLSAQASGAKWSREEIQDRIANANGRSGYQDREHIGEPDYFPLRGRTSGKVAVIPMTGIISHRMNLISEISGGGGSSTQILHARFRAAVRDADCKAIVFDVDSPGGGCDGVVELASEIYEARQQKPIISVCNAMACSAAYWLASAASNVICSPSGQCGSIGVFMILQDESEALKKEGVKITIIKAGKYKAEGHPAEPLTDDAHGFFQHQVDSMYGMFVRSVAQQRGVTQAAVREGMGQGRSLMAADAVRAGLADRLGTLDDVLWKLGVAGTGRPGMGTGAGMPLAASVALSHRKRELDLMRMGARTPSTKAPENGALLRRRRQLDLLAP